MSKRLRRVLANLDNALREKYDPLGFVAEENGAFRTGHMPHRAPQAYLCRRYAGLDERGVAETENECSRYISEPYRVLLSHMNGAHILGFSLQGGIFGSIERSCSGMGQPVSLWYGNAYRPEYIPAGHLRIGRINGAWYSQGHLYLTSTGEVELYHPDFDIIGARWSSLADFLEEELRRQFSLYDDQGEEIKVLNRLPGDTERWEQLSKEVHDKRQGYGWLSRIRRFFRGT